MSVDHSDHPLALQRGRTHTIWPMRDPTSAPTLSPETETVASFVPLPAAPDAPTVVVYSVHDGSRIPHFAAPEARHWANERFAAERDWGANQLAERIGAALGLDGIWQMQIARSVLDFGRLRGITVPGTDHYNRRALAHQFARLLREDEHELALRLYDQAEADLQTRIAARHRAGPAPLVLLGVHTFDPVGTDGRGGPPRARPPVSLLHVPERLSPETYGVEFATALGATTADPRLIAGLSAALQDAGLAPTCNEPYLLPEGSVELRHLARLQARPGRRPSALVIELRKDLALSGAYRDREWQPDANAAVLPTLERAAQAVAAALRAFAKQRSEDFAWH